MQFKYSAAKVKLAGGPADEHFFSRKIAFVGKPGEEGKQHLRAFSQTWKDVCVCRICHADAAVEPPEHVELRGGVIRQAHALKMLEHLLNVHGIDARPPSSPPKDLPSAPLVLGNAEDTKAWFGQLAIIDSFYRIRADITTLWADDWRDCLRPPPFEIPNPEQIHHELTKAQATAALQRVLHKSMAYGSELLGKCSAEAWASGFTEGLPGAKFFTNAKWDFDVVEDPQVFTLGISTSDGQVHITVNNLGGEVVDEFVFTLVVILSDIAAKIRYSLKPSWSEVTFLAGDGSKINETSLVKDCGIVSVHGYKVVGASFSSWGPATEATFDAGVVAVLHDVELVAGIWIEDED